MSPRRPLSELACNLPNQCHRFYALSNELRADADPREIRMPLGTYAYGVADVDAGKGRKERREVVQQLDLEGARGGAR